MKKNKIMLCVFLLIFTFVMLSCNNTEYTKKEKVTILVTKNCIADDEEFKMIVNNYVNDGNEANIIEVEENDLSEELIEKEKVDLIFSNRSNMLKLSEEGLIKELNGYYVENELLNKLNVFNISYSRNKENYYGVAVNPYSIVLLINKNWANNNGINDEINMVDILKKENNIPYILPKNQKIEIILSAFIANNENLSWELTENYGRSKESFENIGSGQKLFDNLNLFVKDGTFNREKFVQVNVEEINKFNNGEIPMLLTSTLISNKLDSNIDFIVLDKFQVSELNINAIADSSGIMLVTSRNKENVATNNFLDYIVKERKLENINKAGIITGNKKLDDKLNKNAIKLKDTIIKTNENNIIYYENLSNVMKNKINYELEKSFNGEGNSNQWKNIL